MDFSASEQLERCQQVLQKLESQLNDNKISFAAVVAKELALKYNEQIDAALAQCQQLKKQLLELQQSQVFQL